MNTDNMNAFYANTLQQATAAGMFGLKFQGALSPKQYELLNPFIDPIEQWLDAKSEAPDNNWNAGKSSWNY